MSGNRTSAHSHAWLDVLQPYLRAGLAGCCTLAMYATFLGVPTRKQVVLGR